LIVYQKVLDFRSFLTVWMPSTVVMFLNFKMLKLLAVVNYLVVSQFISFPEIQLLVNTNGIVINLGGKPAIGYCSRTRRLAVKWKRPSDLWRRAQRSEEPLQSKVAEGAWNIKCGHKTVEGP